MQKVLIGLLAVSTVALAFICVAQRKQLSAAEQRALAAEQQRAIEAQAHQQQAERVEQLSRANERLEQQVQKFAEVTTSLRSTEAAQRSNALALSERLKNTPAAGGNPAEGGLGKGMGEMLGQMMKDPAMREMVREQQKAAINMMYSGLFKDLNLTPEERDKLRDLLTDAQMRNVEAAQGLFGANKDPLAEADAKKAASDAKTQTDAELKALLGNERFAQFEEYQKHMGERMQVDQFKNRLAAENLSLRDDQSMQLMQIMKEEKALVPPVIPTDQTQVPDKNSFTSENLEKQLKWMDDYNSRVLARAGQVLTPQQFEKYRSFQEQQASMQKLGLQMAKQMFGSEKPKAP